MPFGGEIGDIAIPMQQVKGWVIFAKQVIVDHVTPDQILTAQRVESGGKKAAIEIAVARKLIDQLQLTILDKGLQLAAALEIHLRSEIGRRLHLIRLAPAGEHS